MKPRFDDNDISGTLPEEVWSFFRLRTFCGNKNMLEGALPASVGSLPWLHLLGLSGSRGAIEPTFTIGDKVITYRFFRV